MRKDKKIGVERRKKNNTMKTQPFSSCNKGPHGETHLRDSDNYDVSSKTLANVFFCIGSNKTLELKIADAK